MAASDYRLCDVCHGKVFYDANLNYEMGIGVEGSVRYRGELVSQMKLDYLGDWAVICQECAQTHKCVVMPIETEEVGEKYNELLYAVGRKYPGETRHETALRYIRQAESSDSGAAKSAEIGGRQ